MSVSKSPARPLGVGIIGAGGILHHHAAAFLHQGGGARMVGVADIDLGRAEAARRTYGMEVAHRDHRELLARDDVDVICICTRPDSHAQLVAEAVNAGKHVLCEKPIARTLAEADEIIAACDRRPEVLVSCVYQWRSDPAAKLLRTLVAENRLGRAVMADVQLRTSPAPSYFAPGAHRGSWSLDGGGLLIVAAIHQLDLLIFALGSPVEVSARMDTFLQPTEGEDTLVGWVAFDSGTVASVALTSCAHEGRFSVELVGTRASARLLWERPASACRWEAHANEAATQRELRALGRRLAPSPPRDPGRYELAARKVVSRLRGRHWLPPRHWWHTPHVTEFLEAVRSGGRAPVPPREARRSLELVVALYQSALFGEAVRLPVGDASPIYSGVDVEKVRAGRGG